MLLCPHNRFGHPSPEVTERLIDRLGEDSVHRTDQDVTVEFITDWLKLWVKADSRRLIRQLCVYNGGLPAIAGYYAKRQPDRQDSPPQRL
jgi:hypothetical protein